MGSSHTSYIDFRHGTSIVSGQDQYNYNYVVQEAEATAEILQNLQPAHMDASGRIKCLPGTRTETIQFIKDWATGPVGPQNVLWVHGLAGAGKSTLATTVASYFRGMGRLGAFLFFDRAVAERSDPLTVIRTLAHQVGSLHPYVGKAIADAIDESPGICLSPLPDQFQELLVGPLSCGEVIDANIPIVFVLDALDECGNAKRRETLLEVLTEQSVKLPPTVRILITSRLDNDISDAIRSQPHILAHEIEITSNVNRDDVSSYLRHRLELVRRKNRRLPLANDWPGEYNIRKLIVRASGLFAWASTAMEFINGYDPRVRLGIILRGHATSGAQSALDALYTTALESSGLWDDNDFVADFTAIIGLVLVARRPLSTASIDALLRLPRSCLHMVSQLGCVLQQPVVRALHPSFADFLLNRSRCGRDVWFFDPSVHNRTLAIRCLDHLAEVLKKNMCELIIWEDMVDGTLPEDVSYACDFWIDHICAIDDDDTIYVTERLHDFLLNHLLHWFEAMSILRRSRDAISMLDQLSLWVSIQCPGLDSLFGLVRDACQFARVFADSIEEHPLLVYMAALPFTPTHTTLYKAFHNANLYPSLPESFGHAWPALIRILIQHGWSDSGIMSLAFTPDGTRVVSGSFDKMIRIWDATSGTEIHPQLRGHDGWVYSVDVSADGTRIVSGSQDKTVRIWDTNPGARPVVILRGHDEAVLSVAFSADGTHIASGSRDRTIRVWDAIAGVELIKALQGHGGGVSSVAFFPDGMRVVSGSADKTIRVWDLAQGVETLVVCGHEHSVMSVATDGTRIISGSHKNKRIWDAESGLQLSSTDHPTPWFSSEIDDGWIVEVTSGKRFSKIPSIVKTRSWLLEQLTVRYWFSDFLPHFSRSLLQKE